MAKEEFIYGRNPIIEALGANKQIEKILMLNSLRGELEKELRQYCKEHSIPIIKVPEEKLNALVRSGKHQGIVAYLSPVVYMNLQDVISHDYDRGKLPFIVVLEGVNDSRNIAAISRSAYVFGASAIVLTLKNTARLGEETVKISAGALLHIPVCREKNMATIIQTLKNNGIKIISTAMENAQIISKVDLTGAIALILGSEHDGVSSAVIKESDEVVKIPMDNNFDSLNVSVAAGIAMYERIRQLNT